MPSLYTRKTSLLYVSSPVRVTSTISPRIRRFNSLADSPKGYPGFFRHPLLLVVGLWSIYATEAVFKERAALDRTDYDGITISYLYLLACEQSFCSEYMRGEKEEKERDED